MIFLDLETTGLDFKSDEIIEFSAIKTDKNLQEIARLDFLLLPKKELTNQVKFITGIKEEELKKAFSLEDKKDEIIEFLSDKNEIICGHNIRFDLSFLESLGLISFNRKFLDTYDLATLVYPELKSYALEYLSDIFNLEHTNKHRALSDVKVCIDLLQKIKLDLAKFPKSFLVETKKFFSKTDSSLVSFIEDIKFEGSYQKQKRNLYQSDKIENKNNYDLLELKNFNELKNNILNEFKVDNTLVIVKSSYFNLFLDFLPEDVLVLNPFYTYIDFNKLEDFYQKSYFNEEEFLLLLKLLRNKVLNLNFEEKALSVNWTDREIFKSLVKDDFVKSKSNKIFTTYKVFFNNEIDLSNFKNILAVDLDEEELDLCFTAKVSEDFLLKNLQVEEPKIKDFFDKLRSFFNLEDISVYGKQVIIKSDFFVNLKDLFLEGLNLSDFIYQKYPHLKKTAGNLYAFLTYKKGIKYIFFNKEKKVNLVLSPEDYLEKVKKFFPIKTKFLSFNSVNIFSLNYYQKLLGKEFSNNKLLKDFNKTKKILPQTSFPSSKTPEYLSAVKDYILNLSDKKTVYVIGSNQAQLEKLAFYFALEENKEVVLMNKFGKEKNLQKINCFKNPLVFIHINNLFNFLGSSLEFKEVVLLKIPFLPPNPVFKFRKNKLNNKAFSEYVIPRSLNKYQSILKILNPEKLHILDKNILASWAENYLNL